MPSYTAHMIQTTGQPGRSTLGRIVRRIGAWLPPGQEIRHLRELPDYLLDDIGLSRSDVQKAGPRSPLF